MTKRRVFQYLITGEFLQGHDSTTDAARIYGVDEATIRRAANHERKTVNYFWSRYKVDNILSDVTSVDSVSLTKFKNAPKILLLDEETAPLKAYTWGLWKQDISLPQIISDYYILSWSAKWLFDKEMMSDVLTGVEAVGENDYRIICSLWKLLNEADVVITHNGDSFDLVKFNTRCVVHGLAPVSPYKSIDTLKIARSQFGFTSNKLDALAGLFGIDEKLPTNFKLWVSCVNGDEESLRYMEEYNQRDVSVLEEVYLKLRPWIKGNVNISMYYETDEALCPNCGGGLTDNNSYYYTTVNKYKVYRCLSCGAVSRSRVSIGNKEKRKNMAVTIG